MKIHAIEKGVCEIEINSCDDYCVYAHYVGPFRSDLIYIGMGRVSRPFVLDGVGRGASWREATKNGYKVVIIGFFKDRKSAYNLERNLIKSLKPRLNLVHSGNYHPRKNKGRTGIPHSPESIRLMAERAKASWERQRLSGIKHRGKTDAVQCVETGEVFKSMSDASRIMKISLSGISQCANGRRRITKGFTFVRVGA